MKRVLGATHAPRRKSGVVTVLRDLWRHFAPEGDGGQLRRWLARLDALTGPPISLVTHGVALDSVTVALVDAWPGPEVVKPLAENARPARTPLFYLHECEFGTRCALSARKTRYPAAAQMRQAIERADLDFDQFWTTATNSR